MWFSDTSENSWAHMWVGWGGISGWSSPSVNKSLGFPDLIPDKFAPMQWADGRFKEQLCLLQGAFKQSVSQWETLLQSEPQIRGNPWWKVEGPGKSPHFIILWDAILLSFCFVFLLPSDVRVLCRHSLQTLHPPIIWTWTSDFSKYCERKGTAKEVIHHF